MCTGVTRGLAGLKFSTSPSRFGEFEIINMNRIEITVPGSKSFTENEGWNFILSVSVFVLFWFEDPFSCSIIRCTIIIAISTIGKMKCREKNRFRVGWDTDGPPQIHTTKSLPTNGIADRTPVITVAPQNDICPQGSTYPRKAVPMVISMMITPEIHTFGWFDGEEKYMPRAVWIYISTKNRDAPFVWISREIHPMSLSRMIFTITENDTEVSAVYIIETPSPEMICSVKVNPRRNPKFHRNEIEVGVGRSIRDFFIILVIGLLFISCFFIKMKSLVFG